MMNDVDVGIALRLLPRTTTSPRFASDVMRAVRAHEEPSRARFFWKFATSFAMVLILVAGMVVQRQKEARQIESLRAEHRRIETELKQVKAIADEAQPVVVLDNGETRVIVDLNRTTYY